MEQTELIQILFTAASQVWITVKWSRTPHLISEEWELQTRKSVGWNLIWLCFLRIRHKFCSTVHLYSCDDDRCISAQNFKQRRHRGKITGNHKRPQSLGKVEDPNKRAQVPGYQTFEMPAPSSLAFT